MRIKVLSRDEQKYTRERPNDLQRVQRNAAPELHPFERAREYKRALNAVKLDRVFAKPFLGALSGHSDGVFCLQRHHNRLNVLLSGACDGEIRLWNVATQKTISSWRAHQGFVRGVTFTSEGDSCYSCGADKLVHLWDTPNEMISLAVQDEEEKVEVDNSKPRATWMGKNAFLSIDHQRKTPLFVTTGANVLSLWHSERSEPLRDMTWGEDSLNVVRFNPIETNIVATAAEDRSVILYDIKGGTPIRKLILAMKSNSLAWNPMEAFNFTVASEDHNLYTFDMRKLDIARNVHTDHVSAVLAVDYSPTGREFVSGSYDKTLRIYETDQGRSRDVYHTKRMQRIFAVQYSGDANYIFAGSDDTNIRMWKAEASRNIEVTLPRQVEKANYDKSLIERYQHLPEIRKIKNKRRVPKSIKDTQKVKGIIKSSKTRKQSNERRHSKAGAVPFVPERKKAIVKEDQ